MRIVNTRFISSSFSIHFKTDWIRFDGVALVKCPIDDMGLEFDGVVGRKRVEQHDGVVDGARDGLHFVVEQQSLESHIEVDGVSDEMRSIPTEIIDDEVVIMWIVRPERIERVGIIKAQIAIAVGVADAEDDLTRKGAVSIYQIGDAFVGNPRFNGIFHLFLAGYQEHKWKKQKQ